MEGVLFPQCHVTCAVVNLVSYTTAGWTIWLCTHAPDCVRSGYYLGGFLIYILGTVIIYNNVYYLGGFYYFRQGLIIRWVYCLGMIISYDCLLFRRGLLFWAGLNI